MLWINIVCFLGLTSLTGGILVIVWYGIGLILERLGFANIVFELLKMVVSFFLLPIAYIGLRVYIVQSDSDYIFSPTPPITQMCRGIVLLWASGALVMLVYLIHDYFSLRRRSVHSFECSREIQELFLEIKGRVLQEDGRLQIRQSYQNTTPYVEGHLAPKIVLPVANYTRADLRVILVHEMMHYKQGDLTLKLFMRIVLIIHYFNPLAWVLLFKIQKWSEFACDLKASEFIGGIKPYFEVIMRIAMHNPLKSGLTSQLVTNQHDLVERVKKLVRVNKMKRRSRLSLILVLCTAFLMSSTSVYAATVECAETYAYMEGRTADERNEINSTANTLRVYTEYGDAERINCVEGEVISQERGVEGFAWDLPVGYRIYGPYFSIDEGEDVAVTVLIDPRYVDIRVGIEDSWGYRYYVEGSDTIFHTFTTQSSRRHRVYTQNNSGTDVSVTGSYLTR